MGPDAQHFKERSVKIFKTWGEIIVIGRKFAPSPAERQKFGLLSKQLKR